MTISDYQSDVKYLLERFQLGNEDRSIFLNNYLTIKKYTNEELLLLISLAEEQIQALQLEAFIANRNRTENEINDSPEEDRNDRPDKWRHHWEVVDSIAQRLEVPPNPFPPISPGYLEAPERVKIFEIAELNMVRHNYFNRNGSWNEFRHIQDLVTFLNLLVQAKVLKHTTEKDMDHYFSTRYKIESIGDRMKLNKFTTHKKFMPFKFILAGTGLKVEDYIQK